MQNNKIDYASLDNLLDYQLSNDVTHMVALGSTAECSLLSPLEKYKVLSVIRKRTEGICHLMVATGNSNTTIAVKDSIKAYEYGADSLLVVTPYYVGYTTNGLIEHFKQISQCTPLPITLYNVPSRTGHSITSELAVRLYNLGYISGIKECSPNISLSKSISKLDKSLPIYCGNDNMIQQYRKLNMHGCISVIANVYPKLVAQSNTDKATNRALTQLCLAMGKYINPIAIKQLALSKGLIASNSVRLPLTQCQEVEATLKNIINKYGEIL